MVFHNLKKYKINMFLVILKNLTSDMEFYLKKLD